MIDSDASHFLIKNNTNKKSSEKKKKNFIAHTKSNNRFAQPFNKHECSKLIRVTIRDAKIHSEEFDQYMRKTLGMKLIKNVTIAKYAIRSNII